MYRRFALYFCLLFLPASLLAQESEYLLQIQVFYVMPYNQEYQYADTYYGQFDAEPSNVVLNNLSLSRSAQRIQLQLSFYSSRGLITPNEVIINDQTTASTSDISYAITNPAFWPAQKPLKISLFSNWPALDHWIDIPIAWDGQMPFSEEPTIAEGTPASGGLTTKGGSPLPPSNQSTSTLMPGHAVQIMTTNKPPKNDQLLAFQRFGSVYYISEPPFYKIRVGTFPAKADALNQLRAIRRFKKGAYADAFYLNENQTRTVVTVADAQTTADQVPKDYDTGAYVGVKGLNNTQASVTDRTPFAYDVSGALPNRIYYEAQGISIQLSMHATPPNLAEYTYLEDLGNIYILRENNVYKLKIGGFPSKEAAESVMPLIQAAGFPYAFIKIP